MVVKWFTHFSRQLYFCYYVGYFLIHGRRLATNLVHKQSGSLSADRQAILSHLGQSQFRKMSSLKSGPFFFAIESTSKQTALLAWESNRRSHPEQSEGDEAWPAALMSVAN